MPATCQILDTFQKLRHTLGFYSHLMNVMPLIATKALCSQEIGRFLKTFGGQLDANDIADPLESFNTFNQFFYRKLKPSARPIAEPSQDHVVVCATKCLTPVLTGCLIWTGDLLYTITPSQPCNGKLSDAVKVVAQNLSMKPGTSFPKSVNKQMFVDDYDVKTASWADEMLDDDSLREKTLLTLTSFATNSSQAHQS